jgi:hypothetical protein
MPDTSVLHTQTRTKASSSDHQTVGADTRDPALEAKRVVEDAETFSEE